MAVLTWTCTACGESHPVVMRFCPNDATPQPTPTVDPKVDELNRKVNDLTKKVDELALAHGKKPIARKPKAKSGPLDGIIEWLKEH